MQFQRSWNLESLHGLPLYNSCLPSNSMTKVLMQKMMRGSASLAPPQNEITRMAFDFHCFAHKVQGGIQPPSPSHDSLIPSMDEEKGCETEANDLSTFFRPFSTPWASYGNVVVPNVLLELDQQERVFLSQLLAKAEPDMF